MSCGRSRALAALSSSHLFDVSDRQPSAAGRHGVASVDAEVQQGVFKLRLVDLGRPQTAGADHLDLDVGAGCERRINSSMPLIR